MDSETGMNTRRKVNYPSRRSSIAARIAAQNDQRLRGGDWKDAPARSQWMRRRPRSVFNWQVAGIAKTGGRAVPDSAAV